MCKKMMQQHVLLNARESIGERELSVHNEQFVIVNVLRSIPALARASVGLY